MVIPKVILEAVYADVLRSNNVTCFIIIDDFFQGWNNWNNAATVGCGIQFTGIIMPVLFDVTKEKHCCNVIRR